MGSIVGQRRLSVHKEHEVLLKLEAAGLGDVLAQRVIDSKDNELAKKLVQLIAGEGPEHAFPVWRTICYGSAMIDLVLVSVAGLGFYEGAIGQEIYRCAEKFGLELCPNSLAREIQEQYALRSPQDALLIAMRPIVDDGHYIRVYTVPQYGDGSEPWRRGSYGDPKRFWTPETRWIFVRSK